MASALDAADGGIEGSPSNAGPLDAVPDKRADVDGDPEPPNGWPEGGDVPPDYDDGGDPEP